MKKLFLVLILLSAFICNGYAADVTIGNLAADASPGGADIAAIEQSDASATNKATLTNIITKAHGLGNGMVEISGGTMGVATDGTDYISSLAADTTPQLGGPLELNDNIIWETAAAFTGSDATPDVSGGSVFKSADTTTITDFDDGTDHTNLKDGQILIIMFQHAGGLDCTSSQINCNGSQDWTAADGDMVLCTFDDTTDADGQWLCHVSASDLPSLADSNIFVGNASGIATAVNPAGDVEIGNDGATTIQANAVEGSMILDDTIDSGDYAAGSIDAEHLAADIVDETKIADDGIDSEHYNDGSIDAAHLAADIIDETKIADNGIDSEHYNDGSIDEDHLAAALAFDDGDQIDLSGVTYVNAATTNEGIAIPTYVAGSAPADNKPYLAYDAANNRIMVYESGGWADTSSGTGAAASSNFIAHTSDGGLSDERVLTEGFAIDMTDAGTDGGAFTVAFDPTEVSADGTDTWSDGSNASIVWTFDVSGTDHTMTAGNGLMTFGDAVTVTDTLTASGNITDGTATWNSTTQALSGFGTIGSGAITAGGLITGDGLTITTGNALTFGVNRIDNGSDLLDGEQIADDTIDDDSIDFADVTAADITMTDAGAITSSGTVTAGVGFDVTGAADLDIGSADVLDVTIVEDGGTYIFNNGLSAAGEDLGSASAEWGDLYIADDKSVKLGNAQDWSIYYNSTDDRLEFVNIQGTSGDSSVYWDLNDNGADSTYTITNSDATYEANLVVEGDITYSGQLVYGGSADQYIQMGGITAWSPSGNPAIAFESASGTAPWNFNFWDGNTEHTIIHSGSDVTWTAGGSHDFSATDQFIVADNAADEAGEFGINGYYVYYGVTDDAGSNYIKYDFEGIDGNDGYGMVWNDTTKQFEPGSVGGSGDTSWDDLNDPDPGQPASFTMNGADETTTFTMSADNTEWYLNFSGAMTTANSPSLFKIAQTESGGATEAVVVLDVEVTDANAIAAQFGDDTDYTQFSKSGNLTQVGAATATFANDTTVSTDKKVIFRDSDIHIQSATDGDLDITADGDVDVNADLNIYDGTPRLTLNDTDAADHEDTAEIYAQCTTATSAAEDCDIIMSQYIDGTDTEILDIDADGNFEIKKTVQTSGVIELGHATDTTVARASAGVVTIEGENVVTDTTGIPINEKTSDYTIGTDNTNECYGGVIYVTTGATITACDNLASGMAFSVITIGAIAVSLDVQSDDKMWLDGTALNDGDKATNTSTTGDSIVCTYKDATGWYCMSGSPDGDNWTDGGA